MSDKELLKSLHAIEKSITPERHAAAPYDQLKAQMLDLGRPLLRAPCTVRSP